MLLVCICLCVCSFVCLFFCVYDCLNAFHMCMRMFHDWVWVRSCMCVVWDGWYEWTCWIMMLCTHVCMCVVCVVECVCVCVFDGLCMCL